MPIKLQVPRYFVDNQMLGAKAGNQWCNPEEWTEHHAETLPILISHQNQIGLDYYCSDTGIDLASHIIESQALQEATSEDTDEPYIQWQHIARPNSTNRNKLEKGSPFSIVSLVTAAHKVSQNLVYGPNGELLYCIDFADHSSKDHPQPNSVHWHTLMPGAGLERSFKPGEHSHDWKKCPWMWLAIPEYDQEGNKLSVALNPSGYEYETIEVDLVEDAESITFESLQKTDRMIARTATCFAPVSGSTAAGTVKGQIPDEVMLEL